MGCSRSSNRKTGQHAKDPVPENLPALDPEVIPNINSFSSQDCKQLSHRHLPVHRSCCRGRCRGCPQVLFRLECRTPRGKACQLFVRPVIVALAFIQLCDLSHFFFRQSEIQDIQVVPDMIHVFAAGNHDKAHLGMPKESFSCVLCTHREDNRPSVTAFLNTLKKLYKDAVAFPF